jgi:maltooligosyltrehalose synthase
MRGKTYDREFLVNKISMLRIKGKSTYFIIEFLKNEVGMGQTTAYEVLRDAQKLIVDMQSSDIDNAYSEAIAQLEEEYESCKDRKLKLEIRKELNKLQGLYKPQRIDHTTNGKDMNITGITIEIVNKKEDLNDDKERS